MKCNLYRAGDTDITPAKKKKTRLCMDCSTVIPATHNKKVCSACSNARYEARYQKSKHK